MLFLTIAGESYGQSIQATELKKNYIGAMDEVLPAIGADYDIQFVFDADSLHTIYLKLYAFEHNKLGDLFKDWADYMNLTIWKGDNRTIYIAGKSLARKDRAKWIEETIKRMAEKLKTVEKK
jgi:hypothetical protein